MTEPDEQDELTEPSVTDVPEPDQEEHEDEESERLATPVEVEGGIEGDDEPEGLSQQDWEERHGKADKAFKTYTNAVGRIYEEEANDYFPCPLCAASPSGFLTPADVGRFDDEVVGAVMMILGHTQPGNLKKDKYSTNCDGCDGWGITETPSHVPNQETRTCLDCKGVGYIPTQTTAAAPNGVPASVTESDEHHFVPAALGPENPEVQALRLQGYTIIPPMQTGAP